MKRSAVHLILTLLLFVLVIPAEAQQQAVPSVSAERIRGNVYVMKGAGPARTGVVIGEKEVAVIEANMTEAGTGEAIAAIRKLTPLPIGHILLTHSDDDHVNGLPGFPQSALIISQENARDDMAK